MAAVIDPSQVESVEQPATATIDASQVASVEPPSQSAPEPQQQPAATPAPAAPPAASPAPVQQPVSPPAKSTPAIDPSQVANIQPPPSAPQPPQTQPQDQDAIDAIGGAFKDIVGPLLTGAGQIIGKSMEGVSHLDPTGLEAFKQVGSFLSRGNQGTALEGDPNALSGKIAGGFGSLPAFAAGGTYGAIALGATSGFQQGYDNAVAEGKPQEANTRGLETGAINAVTFAMLTPLGKIAGTLSGLPEEVVHGLARPTAAQAAAFIGTDGALQQALFQGQNMAQNKVNGRPLLENAFETAATTLPFSLIHTPMLAGPLKAAIGEPQVAALEQAGAPQTANEIALDSAEKAVKEHANVISGTPPPDLSEKLGAFSDEDLHDAMNVLQPEQKELRRAIQEEILGREEATLPDTKQDAAEAQPEPKAATFEDRSAARKTLSGLENGDSLIWNGVEYNYADGKLIEDSPNGKTLDTAAKPKFEGVGELTSAERAVIEGKLIKDNGETQQTPVSDQTNGNAEGTSEVPEGEEEASTASPASAERLTPESIEDTKIIRSASQPSREPGNEQSSSEGSRVSSPEFELRPNAADYTEEIGHLEKRYTVQKDFPSGLKVLGGFDTPEEAQNFSDRYKGSTVKEQPPGMVNIVNEAFNKVKDKLDIFRKTLDREMSGYKAIGADPGDIVDAVQNKLRRSILLDPSIAFDDSKLEAALRQTKQQITADFIDKAKRRMQAGLASTSLQQSIGDADMELGATIQDENNPPPDEATINAEVGKAQDTAFQMIDDFKKNQPDDAHRLAVDLLIGLHTGEEINGKGALFQRASKIANDFDFIQNFDDNLLEKLENLNEPKTTTIPRGDKSAQPLSAEAERLLASNKPAEPSEQQAGNESAGARPAPETTGEPGTAPEGQVRGDNENVPGAIYSSALSSNAEGGGRVSPELRERVRNAAERSATQWGQRIVEDPKSQGAAYADPNRGAFDTVFVNSDIMARAFRGLTDAEIDAKMRTVMFEEAAHNATFEAMRREVLNNPEAYEKAFQAAKRGMLMPTRAQIVSKFIEQESRSIYENMTDAQKDFVRDNYFDLNNRNAQEQAEVDAIQKQREDGTLSAQEARLKMAAAGADFESDTQAAGEYVRMLLQLARTETPKTISDVLDGKSVGLTETRRNRIFTMLRDMSTQALDYLQRFYDSARKILGFDETSQIRDPDLRKMITGISKIIDEGSAQREAGAPGEAPKLFSPEEREETKPYYTRERSEALQQGREALADAVNAASGFDKIVVSNETTNAQAQAKIDEIRKEDNGRLERAEMMVLHPQQALAGGVSEATRIIMGSKLVEEYRNNALTAKNKLQADFWNDKQAKLVLDLANTGSKFGEGLQIFKDANNILNPEGRVKLAQRSSNELIARKLPGFVDEVSDKLLPQLNEANGKVFDHEALQQKLDTLDKLIKDYQEKMAKAKPAKNPLAGLDTDYSTPTGKESEPSEPLKPQYEEKVADEIAAKLEKRAQLAPEKDKVPLEEFYNKMKDIVQKKLDELHPPPKGKPRPPAPTLQETVRQLGKNPEIFADLIHQLHEKFDEKYGSTFTKDLETILQEPVSNQQIRAGARKAIDFKQLAREHWTKLEETSASFTDKLAAVYGLDFRTASRLAAQTERIVQEEATSAKAKILQSTLNPQKRGEAKILSASEKILQASNLGALDKDTFNNAIAEKFGLKGLTRDDLDQIRQRSEEIQSDPVLQQSEALRNRALQDFHDMVRKKIGLDWKDVVKGYWYGSMLSGVGTAVASSTGRFYRLSTEMALESTRLLAKGDVQTINGMFRGFIDGVSKNGVNEAAAILRHGDFTGQPQFEHGQFTHVLELIEKGDPGIYRALSVFKVFPRLIAGLDTMLAYGGMESRAKMIAYQGTDGKLDWAKRDAAVTDLLKTSPNDRIQARNQAEQEVPYPGANPNERQVLVNRRINEILQEQRPPELVEESKRYAIYSGYLNSPSNNTPIGMVANGYERTANKLIADPLGSKQALGYFMKSQVPFTRIVANFVDDAVNYTPFAFLRQSEAGAKSLIGEEASPRDITLQRMKLIAGLTAMTSVYLASKYFDDPNTAPLWLNGPGPIDFKKRQQWLDAGNEPWTFKLGNVNISYKNHPMFMALASVGGYLDGERYNNLNEKSLAVKMGIALKDGLMGLTDMSFVSGINGIMSTFSKDSRDEASVKSLQNMFTGPIGALYPALLKDVTSWWWKDVPDPKSSNYEFAARFAKGVPIVNQLSGVEPYLNYRGEPIQYNRYPWSRLLSVKSPDELDSTLAKLQSMNVYLPEVSAATKIVNADGLRQKMTPQEFYQYNKSYLQTRAAKLEQELPRLQAAASAGDEEEAKRVIGEVHQSGLAAARALYAP